MLKKHPKFNILYTLILIAQLLAEYNQFNRLKQTTRPLISLSLMLMLYAATKLKGRFHKRIFTGLVFALAGDMLLLQGENYVSYGLAAYLMSHICYISAFYLDFRSAPELDKKGARTAILLCALFSISYYFYIRPYLGMMKLPVLTYIFVTSLLTMMAAFRNQRVNKSSYILILSGSTSFMISDALLIHTKYAASVNYAGVLIITSYMLAQYLVIMGSANRKLLNNNR